MSIYLQQKAKNNSINTLVVLSFCIQLSKQGYSAATGFWFRES